MGIKRLPTRYAHSDGHTDVCYSQNGTKLITCGTDGDVRIWADFDDDDPIQKCVGEWALCVKQMGEHIYIATDNNNVQVMTYPEAERDGILARFTAPVNHIAVGKDNEMIAIASEDMEVKLVDIKKKENMFNFNGLSGPPLAVALCPKAKTLAVSCGDGHLYVWNVENQSLLKKIECVPKTNSFMNAKILCRIDFDPNTGKHLAYPEGNVVNVISIVDWDVKYKFECKDVIAPYSIVQFSPCGNFIASSTQKGDIVIWEVTTQLLIGVTKHPKDAPICAFAWNPTGKGEIAYCDTEGQLGLLKDCKITQSQAIPLSDLQAESSVLEDGDEENENEVSIEKLKREILGEKEDSEIDFDKASSRAPSLRPRTPDIPLQLPFMPTSTPDHLNPRYLCWNDIGIVRSYNPENEDDASGRSIEVEFHDSATHNDIMMQNYQQYTMASLSAASLVMGNSNQITVVSLESSAKDWSTVLPQDEEIILVASSTQLVCFATTNYMVHVFTTYGTQKAVFCVPGPPICMCAHQCYALIAYHLSGPQKGHHNIGIMLVKLEGTEMQTKILNNLSRAECSLQYLGFTDCGTPAIQDSRGIIYLYPIKSDVWIPFCDTSKHSNNEGDGFFVTSIFESCQTVRGIKCRGSMYPSFTPRPTLMELTIEPLFVEMTTEKSQLEANLFTWSTLSVEQTEKKYKETALKLFALACKNHIDQRALELMEMIDNSQLCTLAIKYAAKLERKRLSEKLMELARRIGNDDDDSSKNNGNSTVMPSVKKYSFKATDQYAKVVKNVSVSETIEPVKNQDISNISVNTTMNESSLSNSLSESAREQPQNPFLVSTKPAKTRNPLSMMDEYEESSTASSVKMQKEKSCEKRKQAPSEEADNEKGKQRKLDAFMFTKRSK